LIGDALTRGDILGCLRAVAAFAPVLLAPGYCLAWACDFLGFRRRAIGERLAWSIALSFAVVTICAVELGKYGSLTAVCWLAGICAVGFVAIILRDFLQRPRTFLSGWKLLGAGIAVAWILFVVAELVDVGVGARLYLSVTVFDHALRTSFVDAVMRTGVPPASPLFWPGHAVPMRYYYFWYVLAAAAARLGGVTARQAMIASVVWSGFGLAAIVSLYCRHFLGTSPSAENLSRSSGRRLPSLALALALLAVTGLDILPALVKAILRLPADGDMEWWSGDQVTSWIDSLIWVPHHIAGLVCCLFGFLLVWMSKGLSVTQRCLCGIVAGISFASAFGLSTWVPFAFAMVLLPWMVWALVWERESRKRVPVLLGAGLVAVLALLPYLHELRSARSGTTTVLANQASNSADLIAGGSIAGNASHLLRFGIRRIIDADDLSTIPWIANLAQSHPRLMGPVAGLAVRLFLLLPGYFVELGFYGFVLVIALLAARRSKLDESMRTSLFLVCAAMVVSTFLRSTVISSNDFGWRSTLIAQFFVLLLAVRWCEGSFGQTRRSMRVAMQAMIWIGLAGTVYQAVQLRLYLPVEERLGRADESGLAERAMSLRRGFAEMDRLVPKDAVIQFNTTQPSEFLLYAHILQARRQMASAVPGCGIAFGGDPSQCGRIEMSVASLFSPDKLSGATLSAAQARGECESLGVSYLVATRWDPVWSDSKGWVWKLSVVADTGDVRVVKCSEPAR
jgi:hypothetical protein